MSNAPLFFFSLVYLGFIVAFVFSVNEYEDWERIRGATIRRLVKLLLAVLGIAVAVMILTD